LRLRRARFARGARDFCGGAQPLLDHLLGRIEVSLLLIQDAMRVLEGRRRPFLNLIKPGREPVRFLFDPASGLRNPFSYLRKLTHQRA
jgi:hypothetical protein